MRDADTVKFKILISKWKDPKNTKDINKLNSLAEETIKTINGEPIIKEICEIFLYAISTKAISDPNFRNMQSGGFPKGAAR